MNKGLDKSKADFSAWEIKPLTLWSCWLWSTLCGECQRLPEEGVAGVDTSELYGKQWDQGLKLATDCIQWKHQALSWHTKYSSFLSPAVLAFRSSLKAHSFPVGATLKDWYNDQKCVMSWFIKPVTISRVMMKEGGLMTSQPKFLSYRVLLPQSAQKLDSHGRHSHPTVLNASGKRGKIFVQELEKLYQLFLSKRCDRAFLKKQC